MAGRLISHHAQGGNIQSFLATPTRIYTTVYVYRYTAYTIYRQHGAKLLCDCARRAAAALYLAVTRARAHCEHILVLRVCGGGMW